MKPFFLAKNMKIEELRSLFDYDSDLGVLRRKFKTCHSKVGDTVGTIDCAGYLKVSINKKFYYLHRLIWLYVTGSMPNHVIDHINGNRSDNRISNLRDIDVASNIQNQKKANSANKSTRLLGVYQSDRDNPTAKIKVDGKSIHLGTFKTKDDAHDAYIQAKRKYHKGSTL